MSQSPAYSFAVEKSSKKVEVLKSKLATSTGGWPIFYIQGSSSKPHITVTRADNPNHIVATVTFHSFSSKIDLNLHGQSIQLKRKDHLSGGHCFYHPAAGELRWKESGLLSSGLSLVDSNGFELCKYKKRHGFDVFAQVDHAFMDLILISGLAVAKYKKIEDDAAAEASGEIVSAVAGV